MKQKVDLKILAKKLRISIPNNFEVLNTDVFTNNSGTKIQFRPSFHSGLILKNEDLQIEIDEFVEPADLESYWKGRMGSDLWSNKEQYLGIAKCVEPYGFIVWSLNEGDYGSIHFEYTYEYVNDTPKRVVLASDLNSFLAELEPYTFADRK